MDRHSLIPKTTNLFQKKALFLENFSSLQTIFFVRKLMFLWDNNEVCMSEKCERNLRADLIK